MDSYDYEEYYEDTTTTHMIQNTGDTDAFILRRRKVLYCGACGMPPNIASTVPITKPIVEHGYNNTIPP